MIAGCDLASAGDLAAARRMHRFLGTWLGDDDEGLADGGAAVIDLDDWKRDR